MEERNWENWKDDGIAECIHEYWTRSPYELTHRETLSQLVKSIYLPGDLFLEVGCGSGLVYKYLVPKVMDNQQYRGIDITKNMLDIARKDYPNGIFSQDDVYHLSFEDNSYDIVAAFEVLGHLCDIEMPIQEMSRVASRLMIFTVWSSEATYVTEEQFGNSRFIHTAFSHEDIVKSVGKSVYKKHTIQCIPLQEHITAYMILF